MKIIKYILHINDSGFPKDKMAFQNLGDKIPLKTGQHYKDFDVDLERMTADQINAYADIKKHLQSIEGCENPHLPIGTDLVSFKKGWKLEVIDNEYF